MEKEYLKRLIEAVVFASGEPIDKRDILSKIDVSEKEYKSAVDELKEKYNKETSGIVLLEFGSKLQLASSSNLAEDVSVIISPVRERALSKSTIETLSIIAYKQPITRLEIEEIRGVSSDYAMNVLLDHKLIEVVGRKDALGRPLLFGTTDEFLKRFNLESIESLPDKDSLASRIETIKKETGDGLYRNYDVPDGEIIPEKVLEKLKEASKKISEEKAEKFNLVDPGEDFGSDGDDFV